MSLINGLITIAISVTSSVLITKLFNKDKNTLVDLLFEDVFNDVRTELYTPDKKLVVGKIYKLIEKNKKVLILNTKEGNVSLSKGSTYIFVVPNEQFIKTHMVASIDTVDGFKSLFTHYKNIAI